METGKGRQEPLCRTGLEAGMVAKDEQGTLKLVTRVSKDQVYWRYENSGPHGGEIATDYEQFVNHHFVTPRRDSAAR